MTVYSLTAHYPEARASDLGRRGEPDATSLRERIVTLFEKHRATPGAPYDDGDFMNFLLAEPKRRRAVLEGVQALRRFNAFMDDVQFELGIYFPTPDRTANYSLQNFVQRAAELAGSRVGSRPSLKSRIASGIEWPATVLANIVLLTAAVSLRNHEWALVMSGFIALFVNAEFATFVWKVGASCRQLQSRIEAEASRARRRPPELRIPAAPDPAYSRNRAACG